MSGRATLTERRKRAAMLEIQSAALDLFRAEGYRAVSVERVAGAAGVSPSTVYRYFGTKENLVVWDDLDPQFVALLKTSGPDGDLRAFTGALVSAARVAVPVLLAGQAADRVRFRMSLVASEPDVRSGFRRQAESFEAEIASILRERFPRQLDPLTVRFLAAEAVWGVVAGIDHWVESGFAEPVGDVVAQVIELLELVLTSVLRDRAERQTPGTTTPSDPADA